MNYVPVKEGLGARRATLSAYRRLGCCVCRRSAVNRGLCEHESVVSKAVSKLGMDRTNINAISGRRYRKNWME